MYEKIFVKITFADSLQWPVCNYLLCNKKDSSHCNLVLYMFSFFVTLVTFPFSELSLVGLAVDLVD